MRVQFLQRMDVETVLGRRSIQEALLHNCSYDR